MSKNIFIIHGWGGTIESLRPLSEYLQKNNKVFLLELPGHGNTKEMDVPWGMKQFAAWIKNEIVKTNVQENIVLIGHSFGGKAILEILSSELKKDIDIKSVVLINSNGIKPKNSIKKIVWKTLSYPAKKIDEIKILKPINNVAKKAVYYYVIGERDYFKTAGNVRESFKLFNEEHYNKKLGNITVPTLIIWGKHDSVTPLWMGEYLTKNIKGSKLVVLEGTHSLPLKNPTEVATIIEEFIN